MTGFRGERAVPELGPAAGEVISAAVRERTEVVIAALEAVDEAALLAPSALPQWSRLTIACHLRYGARASLDMTRRVSAGHAASFYPQGRTTQRPGTLVPESGETAIDVVASLRQSAEELDQEWAPLGPDSWLLPVREPHDKSDLGPVNLAMIALLRLTEVEVHGDDLDLGLPDWADVFIEHALPTRLAWLATRRTNHRAFDRSVRGSWLLAATDTDLRWFLSTNGEGVISRAATDADAADTRIDGAARDLLAVLLGRRARALRTSGDEQLLASFAAVFPGP
jgi:uncharacterized protein (TIGR03083 family)